jgi:alpha-beta hydrolase superfamily lysophospholipase
MNVEPCESALAFSRPVEESARPRRQELCLRDGYRTGVYVYGPSQRSDRLPVLYVHGIQSHPGWFVGSCAYLAGLGHPVFAVCRRGSGDNVVHRGHAASAGQLLDDVETACRYVLEIAEQRRLALVGVSWGGKLLACYAANPARTVEVASLTLVAPGIVPRVDVGPLTKLSIALAMLVAPQRRFDIPLNDVELFTDNPVMQQYLRADRHRLLRATARMLYVSKRLDVMLSSASAGAVDIPTTLILAGNDRIIDNAGTRRVVERLTAGRAAAVVTKILNGAHTLEFEPDPTPLYHALGEAVHR